MRRTRAIGLGALVATSLVLAGCGSVGSSDTSTTSAPAGSASASAPSSGAEASGTSGAQADTINVGIEQSPGGFNGQSAGANSVYTAYVDNLTQRDFVDVQPDGSLKANPEFGSYKKTSDSPLTVEYTFSDKAVWSDGTPIDCDDAMLAWAALSNSYPTGTKDDAGNDVDLFTPASTNGFNLINKPSCAPGDKTFTTVYSEPYADWEAVFSGAVFMPAHIAAAQGGMSADGDGKALIDASPRTTVRH